MAHAIGGSKLGEKKLQLTGERISQNQFPKGGVGHIFHRRQHHQGTRFALPKIAVGRLCAAHRLGTLSGVWAMGLPALLWACSFSLQALLQQPWCFSLHAGQSMMSS